MTEPLLRTEGLTRHFRVGKLFSGQTLHAVDDVDLTIGRGEMVSLLGRNGMGKTTTVRSIMGLTPPSAGSNRLLPPDRRWRAPGPILRRRFVDRDGGS